VQSRDTRLSRLDPETLVGRPWSVVYAPGASGRSLVERVRLHGAVFEEGELLRIDGSRYAMQLRATVSRWGERDAIVVTLRDVRDRRDAEAARRTAEAKYESIFAHCGRGHLPDDARRPISQREPGARAHLRLRLDRRARRPADRHRRPALRRSEPAPSSSAACSRTTTSSATSSPRCAQGRSRTWISENARAVRDASGRLRYYEGTVVDISLRKSAEAERQAEAEVAHALAHVGREMIASLGSPAILERLAELAAEVLACDRTHLWIWDNGADAYLSVASGDDVAGPLPRAGLADLLVRLTCDEIAVVSASDVDQLPARLRELQRGFGEALYFAIRRGGVAVGVLAAMYRRRPEPFTRAQARIARGVAHLTSLALEHARVVDELERANKLKSEFVATISHEFRTPINIMLGYNEMLLDEESGRLSRLQSDLLARLGRTTRSLADLVDATLDLSRLDAGRLPIELGAVDLTSLLLALHAETTDLVRAKPALTLAWNVADALPAIHTDPAKLRIVLKNLLDNAVKFTERGSITLTAASRLGGVEVTVADTGAGIAPHALSYVFEAFRQGDASPTRRHDGVGLGLHLVQRYVTVLGGTIDVTSVPGEGSTFRVWLPARP
jgi:signal transduction histidine kinase/PAS domain-containing protein